MKRTTPSLFRGPARLAAGLCLLALLAGCAGSRLGTSEPESPRADTPPPSSRVATPADSDHARTVRALASEDFDVRAQAARRLTRAGEAALPALGRAGDMPVAAPGGLQVSATSAVVRAVIRGASEERLMEHLGSPWANVRREAAGELGRRNRWSAVPRLIDHLEDADPGVRAASAAALRRATNNFFGYQAQACVAHRRVRAGRWRSWWSQEGRARERERAFGAKLDVPASR